MSFVIFIVVVVVDTLSWLMGCIFFINVHLHRFVIEMGSPNLIPKIVTLPYCLPRSDNTVIVLGICMGFMCEHIPVNFPLKTNINSLYTHLVYFCVLVMSNSCTTFESRVIN